MNKTEYMNELKQKLKKFGDELQQEILDDYVQHFAEGEAAGKSDEEIMEELGNIEDMIQELGDAGETAPITGAEAVPGRESEEKETLMVRTDDGTAGKKFSNIFLKTGSANIVLKKSEDEWIHAKCLCEDGVSMDDIEFYQYGEGDTFYAEIRQKDEYERKFSFYKTVVTVGKHFFPNGSGVTLVVKVPEGEERLKFETKSGNVRGESIGLKILEGATGSGDISLNSFAGSETKLITASGDISLNSFASSETKLTTASGDINLNSFASSKIQVITASGDIRMSKCAVEVLEAGTASGDVVFEGGACDEMAVKASSGDVSCSCSKIRNVKIFLSSGDVDLNINAESCELSASSGDICVTMEQPPKRVKAHTCSGDISLELRNTENADVALRTRGGDISLRRGEEDIQVDDEGSYRHIFGSGDCEIKAETSQGDIDVQL